MRDPVVIVADATERAAAAGRLLESPALQQAHQRLVETYIDQWRESALDTVEGAAARDAAFFMLKALDALMLDLRAAAAGGAITQHNLGASLRSTRRI